MRSFLRLGFVATLLMTVPVVAAWYSAADDASGSPSEVSASDPQPVQEALKQYPSPTAEEARTFAETLAFAMCNADPNALKEIIDWDVFLDLCFTEITMDAKRRSVFEQGVLGRLEAQGGFFGQVHKSLGEDGTYELVRVHEVDGRQRALFRLVYSEGVNYHDFVLIRDAAGRPLAVDIFVYGNGELLSTAMRRMIQRLAAEEHRGFFRRLFGKQQDSLEVLVTLQQMIQFNQQGKAVEALKVYAASSKEAKHDKNCLLQRYGAAAMLPDEAASCREIEATVDLFRQKYPQDPALDFLAIDYHIARKEYDRAVQAVNRLDRAVGGDAYLHELRGDILYYADDLNKAVEQYELAIAGLSHRDSAYFGLITIALEREDYAATLAELNRLDQAIPLEWSDFSGLPEYAGFVDSRYHAQWLQYLESKDAPR